jgi:hypothetical protein
VSGFTTSSHPTTDLFGRPVLQRLHFGTCRYIVSPLCKALWNCSYKFSKEELYCIYEYANTHRIGFGKAIYVQHNDGPVVFECWHPVDTWPVIRDKISSAPFATTKAKAIAEKCVEYMRTEPERVQTLCMVGLSKCASGSRFSNIWEIIYYDNTYVEAIENGMFIAGLQAVGSIKL